LGKSALLGSKRERRVFQPSHRGYASRKVLLGSAKRIDEEHHGEGNKVEYGKENRHCVRLLACEQKTPPGADVRRLEKGLPFGGQVQNIRCRMPKVLYYI